MRYFTSSLASLLLTACLAVSTAWSQAGPGHSSAEPFFPPFGLDLSAIDKHTRPQDDFYQYVNGAWIARTTIPADKDQVEETGNVMQDRIDARIRALLEAAANGQRGPAVTAALKAGAMYAAFMDADHIEALGFSPIEPELAAVRAASDRPALAKIMGQSFAEFGGSIFAASFHIDLRDPQHYALYLNQAGLGMPDRRYYLLEEFAGERRGYQEYVRRLLTLVKWTDPVESAKSVAAFEGRIAEASWSAAEQRDAVKSFNIMSVSELTAFAPGFAWQEFLAGSPVINGFTGDQRFFMSYAQQFRAKVRQAKLREAAVSDAHSADKFRVLGVLQNVDNWYEAFDVKPGDRMYRPPAERVRIW